MQQFGRSEGSAEFGAGGNGDKFFFFFWIQLSHRVLCTLCKAAFLLVLEMAFRPSEIDVSDAKLFSGLNMAFT